MRIINIFNIPFSNFRRTIVRAVKNLRRPNKHDSDAVDARREIDLRLGAIFSRYQMLTLAKKFSELQDQKVTYGTLSLYNLAKSNI